MISVSAEEGYDLGGRSQGAGWEEGIFKLIQAAGRQTQLPSMASIQKKETVTEKAIKTSVSCSEWKFTIVIKGRISRSKKSEIVQSTKKKRKIKKAKRRIQVLLDTFYDFEIERREVKSRLAQNQLSRDAFSHAPFLVRKLK